MVGKTIITLTLLLNLCLPISARQAQPENREIIGNSTGLIVFNRKSSNRDFIHIYNRDGSIWHKFTFYYDERSGQFPYSKADFRPFAFHQDYYLLALKCVGKANGRYEVIVNEETALKKYVLADDPLLSFETWTIHILSAFSIGFNNTTNPLLKTKRGLTKKDRMPDVFFHPVKIEGNWLMVKWETDQRHKRYDYGWIKWREREKLLVELFYFA